eukprot:6192758-Pleurochrysis_carterae.AAC.1
MEPPYSSVLVAFNGGHGAALSVLGSERATMKSRRNVASASAASHDAPVRVPRTEVGSTDGNSSSTFLTCEKWLFVA